jgi:hypothetical protein
MYALLAANTLGYIGLALAEICQLLARNSAKRAWHVQNQPHSLHSMVTSLFGPIWRGTKWSSSGLLAVLAANNLGFIGLALAEICQLLGRNSAKRAWHVHNQPKTAFIAW